MYYMTNRVAKGYRSLARVTQIVKTAFLQDDLGKEISMTQQRGFTAVDVLQATGLMCRHMSDPGARCFMHMWRTGRDAGRKQMMIWVKDTSGLVYVLRLVNLACMSIPNCRGLLRP
jgi:hypothetical protein